MWLLIVIILNLQASPPHIQHGEVVGTYSTEKNCLKAMDALLEEYKPIALNISKGESALEQKKIVRNYAYTRQWNATQLFYLLILLYLISNSTLVDF